MISVWSDWNKGSEDKREGDREKEFGSGVITIFIGVMISHLPKLSHFVVRWERRGEMKKIINNKL